MPQYPRAPRPAPSEANGFTIPSAQITAVQIGALNATRSNLILVPTSYGARPEDLAWLAGPVLDPERWCIVIAGMFGNGASSSPSHGAMGLAEQGWLVSHRDNVVAQRHLLREVFGVERIPLIYGWSMGAQQAYQWAVDHPEQVERICCVGGTARTSPHNRLFCLSLRQALTADRHWTGADFSGPPEQGLRQQLHGGHLRRPDRPPPVCRVERRPTPGQSLRPGL